MADYEEQEERLEEAKSAAKAEEKCSSCGGPMKFDPASGQLVCDYCGNTKEVKTEAPAAKAAAGTAGAAAASDKGAKADANGKNKNKAKTKGAGITGRTSANGIKKIPIEKADDKSNCNWGEEKKVIKCKSCGASAVYDATQISDTCPYCDSNLITEEPETKTMAPQGIVPFKTEQKDAAKKFQDWIGSVWFAPNDLQKRSKTGTINGLYAPYWGFDSNAKAEYTGEYGIDREERDSQGHTHTETDWYNCSGSFRHFFEDYLIQASNKENSKLIDNIGNFDLDECKPYNPQYVSGYVSERYAIGVNDSWQESKERMIKDLESMASDDIRKRHREADRARVSSLDAKFSDTCYEYLLLPLWLSSYQYKGKVYHFVVNGQTGEIDGDYPKSVLKILLTIICVLVGTYLILFNDDVTIVNFIETFTVIIVSWLIAKIFA